MPPESQFWWNWWVNVALAAGTFAAVLVALFGDKWRALLFPPILRLRLFSNEGERFELKDPNGNHADWTRYYFIHVWNARRWSAAEQTQVSLIRLEKMGLSGGYETMWSGDVPIRWRNQEFVPLLRTIGPPADCDFCRVEQKGVLRLLPILIPTNMPRDWKTPCEFIAHLQASSTHADSEVLRLKVKWDGGWHDGIEEMKRHFAIAEYNPA